MSEVTVMRVPLVFAVALAAIVGSADANAADIAVRAFDDGLKARAKSSAWLPQRLADLTADALARVGHDLADRTLLGSGPYRAKWMARRHLDAVVTGKVKPATSNDPTVKLSVRVKVHVATGKPVTLKANGTAEHVEAIAAELAAGIAKALGAPLSEATQASLRQRSHSYLVHRYLGEAQRDLDAGKYVRARLKFDRAGALRKFGVVPEAVLGSRAARAPMDAERQGRRVQTESDLARAAREKAEVMGRRKETSEAVAALLSFVRYTPRRAMHFALRHPLATETSRVVASGRSLIVQSAQAQWRVDPVWGTLLGSARAAPGLVGAVGQDLLTLDGRKLTRHRRDRAQWRFTLPFAFELPGGRLPHFANLAPFAGEGSLLWVDLGVGGAVKTVNGVRLLAHGSDGAAVSTLSGGSPTIALLRPGRDTPAWKAELPPPPWKARMVNGRVLVLTRNGLLILDAPDGKLRATVPVGEGARWLGAQGRYAIIGTDDGVAIIDVLAGVKTGEAVGPPSPVAALGTATGVAVAYASGDVISYDRDGVVLDRGRVPGTPFAMEPGDALAPGPRVLSDRGMFAFGEVPEPGTWRDVDGWLELAKLLAGSGEPAAAMRVLDRLALESTGRVAAVEGMRAGLLAKSGDAAGAELAKARVRAAKNPRTPLPRFTVVAPAASSN